LLEQNSPASDSADEKVAEIYRQTQCDSKKLDEDILNIKHSKAASGCNILIPKAINFYMFIFKQ